MMLIQDKFIVGFVGLLASVLFLCGLTTLDAQPQRLQDLTPTPCDLVNKEEKMLVFFAPIFHESQLKDILPQNVPYSIIGDASAYGYYQIEYEQGEQGWIEFHTMISNGDCPYAPSVDLNYSDFPSVCFYTITEPLGIYSDVELTKLDYEVDSADLPITYPIVSWTDQVIERMPDYSPGRFIEANHGTFSGHCEGTLQLATVLENARVWSEPDVTVGQVITSLEAGTEVGIIDGPVSGKLLTDSDLSGNWYKITWGDITGWVWEDRLVFGRTFSVQQPVTGYALALEGAHLWTQPDVSTGKIITTLFTGSSLNLIGAPVEGLIRADPATQGSWYPVQQGGTTGWVYAGQLEPTDKPGKTNLF